MKSGFTMKKRAEQDWSRFDAMTDEEIHAAALSDPDAQPSTEEQLKQFKRVRVTDVLCRITGLSLEELAETYQLPIDLVRDWAEDRAQPDPALRPYIRLIAKMPREIAAALSYPRAAE